MKYVTISICSDIKCNTILITYKINIYTIYAYILYIKYNIYYIIYYIIYNVYYIMYIIYCIIYYIYYIYKMPPHDNILVNVTKLLNQLWRTQSCSEMQRKFVRMAHFESMDRNALRPPLNLNSHHEVGTRRCSELHLWKEALASIWCVSSIHVQV